MIISKTPVRISIGGGGTDLPSFYRRFGSQFISAAINKYVYIVLQERRFYEDFVIKYSKTETAKRVEDIENELVRESLKLLGITTPLEIVSFSDVGGMTGLGSSGAFTVGLLNALHAYKGEVVNQYQLAEEACHIAIDVLGHPSGKQDEYIAAFGGLTAFEINREGAVTISKNIFSGDFVSEFEKNLYMFYTGIRRESSVVLSRQKEATENDNKEVITNLQQVLKLGQKIKIALANENGDLFGRLTHKHWLLKRQRAKTTSEEIDDWYQLAQDNGALGGKLMGAGGGGFFLFYCNKKRHDLIEELQKKGLKYVPFRFEQRGSKVIIDI